MAKLLVIDDNESIRVALQYYITDLGHEIVAVPDSNSGLQLLTENGFDAVIVDLNMPRVSGAAVCRAIRANPGSRDLPVVIMSRSPSKENARLATEAGATTLLPKPFDFEMVRDTLARCLPAA